MRPERPQDPTTPRGGGLLRRLPLTAAPFDLFRSLQRRFGNTFLLESMEGPERLARYSILGFNPQGLISVHRGRIQVIGDLPVPNPDERPTDYLRRVLGWGTGSTNEGDGGGSAARKATAVADDDHREEQPAAASASTGRSGDGPSTEDPLAALMDTMVPFNGGLVGYFGYDYVRYVEALPDTQDDDEGWPDAMFGLYLDGLVHDHADGAWYYFSRRGDRSGGVLLAAEDVERNEPPAEALRIGALRPNMDQAHFESGVRTLQDHIREGDVFQAVLSKRLDAEYRGDITGFYERLRRTNPSPYMYHMTLGERHIIGSSPEMLVRVETDAWRERRARRSAGATGQNPRQVADPDGAPNRGPSRGHEAPRTGGATVETFPIAGTRPLGRDDAERAAYAGELLADAKEAAEHDMLVDLARNDVGRVAAYGTVRVPDYRRVERYSHVQHIVSRVTARLADGKDALDAFEAVFPAGTVTGAPKVRAMEILERLEPTRRGPYAGAVGYIAFNGNLDTAITIRTLTATHRRVSIQSGAGIVQDSDPTKEWEETQHKAHALVETLQAHAAASAPSTRAPRTMQSTRERDETTKHPRADGARDLVREADPR